MADQDRYSNQDQNRDRLGQRDVYMDNRTGVGAQERGYRAQWGGGRDRDRDYGDREQNYNMRRGENASFRDEDYGQQDGGRTGYRGRDDESRYGAGYGGGAAAYGGGYGSSTQSGATGGMAGGYYGESGTYGQGGRWSRNESYEGRQGGTGRGEHRGRDWLSYPARSNPDFYADENRSAGAGWTEEYGNRDRSLETYRGQNRDEGRWSGGEGGYRGTYGGGYRSPGTSAQPSFPGRTYEADATFHDRKFRDRDFSHEYHEDRGGFWDRAADKVASWFGGDESRGSPYDTGVSHRGRGPKGYRRSDERIREDISDRLTDDHWLDASEIDVRVENGDVHLTGEVKTRDDKRRAEQLAEQVSGVDNVMNHLRVEKAQDWRSDRTTGSTTGTTTSMGAATGATTSNMGDLGTPASTTGNTTTGTTNPGTTTAGRGGKTTQ
jgi:osmotically-inducible protein OsmY